jgi:flagellar biosynthesis component FlhA
MSFPPIIAYLLLLLAITYFKPEHMDVFNNVLGKAFLLMFVSLSAYCYGIPTGVISALIVVMVLHTSYEGFREGEGKDEEKTKEKETDEEETDEKETDEKTIESMSKKNT